RAGRAGPRPEAGPRRGGSRGSPHRRALRAAAPPCLRRAGAAHEAVAMRALLVLLLQSAGWTSTPLRPTIGDTIWLTRTVAVPAGWRVRAGRLEPSSDVEPLADPLVARTPG